MASLGQKFDKIVGQVWFMENIVAYVKDEGSNVKTMIVTLKSTISCGYFGLKKSFQDTCFGHAFEKTWQYDITKEKVYKFF